MQFSITIQSDEDIILPQNYNHILQGFIYKNLDDKIFRYFMHEVGYQSDGRKFKLFTYSRLMYFKSRCNESKTLNFGKEAYLVVSAYKREFGEELCTSLMNKEALQLGDNKVYITNIELKHIKIGSEIKVKTFSPLVVHTTEYDNKPRYYSPHDSKFNQLITNNIIEKYKAVYNEYPEDDWFEIIPIYSKNDYRLIPVMYEDFIIKGCDGSFTLRGNPKLLELAFYGGLGTKNPQGFGRLQILSNEGVC